MKTGPRYHVKPRRHLHGITDYRKRLALLKAKKPRIVIRKSLKQIRVQFVTYNSTGDKVLCSSASNDLIKQYGWKHAVATTPAAYLTGLLAGNQAKEKGLTEGVLDIGRAKPTKGNVLFAALKGVLDAGVECPHDNSIIPSEDRLFGKHLSNEIEPMVKDLKEKILGGK